MSFFGKKFKQVRSENLDQLITATGSSGENLKILGDAVTWFTDNGGGSYTYNMEGAFGKMDNTFKNGQEIDQPSRGGVPQTIKYFVEGNKVTQTATKEGKVTTLVREYDGDKMTLTISVSGTDVTAKIFQEAV